MKAGGRGKAGGVKLADNPEDAKARAQDILGLDIKGHITHKVMVAQASDIAEEYYFSYLLDRSNRTFLAMASKEGGMEIEQLAVERPEALARIPVDASEGVDEAKAAEIVDAANFPAEVRDQVIAIAVAAVGGLHEEDATLVEINPLAKAPGRHRPGAGRARSPSTRTPTSGSPTTPRSRTPPPPTRSRPRPRRRTSTTSSSTARSASSATAPAWS